MANKDNRHKVKMEVFYQGKPLGVTYVEDGSSQTHRYVQALLADLTPFDKFVLDDGRVTAEVVDRRDFDRENGFTSVNKGEMEYWNVRRN